MAVSIVMPALEMAQETGKLLSWRKKEGERVVKGEPLIEVETDKAVVEVESPGEGILAGIKAREGAVVPVGQTIAWLVQEGEAPPADSGPAQTGRRQDGAAAQSKTASAASVAEQASAGSARISPKARRLAREHGVDISGVRGTGAGGEVLAEDVLAASSGAASLGAGSSATAAPANNSSVNAAHPASSAQLGVIARLMAERTTQSWTTVPHFFVTREVDAGALVEAHRNIASSIQNSASVAPTLTDALVALVAGVLAKHPYLNASWIGGNGNSPGIRQNPDVNIGIAMAVDEGVVVGVIPKADKANLGQIAVRRRELTDRARAGRLQPADITGATFTISNLGMYEVDAFTAIIVPPQAGILAVGRIADRVVPVNGQPGIRPILNLTLSTDHRVADGARAALFMKDLAAAIGESFKLLK